MKAVAALLSVSLLLGCASVTTLTTFPEGAKVYVDGEYKGVSPLAYRDTATIFATHTARFELEGYEVRSTRFSRDGPLNVGAAVGTLLAAFPALWIRDYQRLHRLELRPIRESEAYRRAAESIAIGDSKESVLGLLMPTQEGLDAKSQRAPDQYVGAAGVQVEIHYFRSNVRPDGKIGKFDYTPYVFEDGQLLVIGWQSLDAYARSREELR